MKIDKIILATAGTDYPVEILSLLALDDERLHALIEREWVEFRNRQKPTNNEREIARWVDSELSGPAIPQDILQRTLNVSLGVSFGRGIDGLVNFLAPSNLAPLINLPGWGARFTGRTCARVTRQFFKDGGKNFCLQVDYCKRKNTVVEGLADLASLGEAFSAFRERLLKHLEEKMDPDQFEEFMNSLDEILERAVNAMEEYLPNLVDGSTIIADGAFPVLLLLRALKHGFDELCPCCEPCHGSGTIHGAPCRYCEGSGQKMPFPH